MLPRDPPQQSLDTSRSGSADGATAALAGWSALIDAGTLCVLGAGRKLAVSQQAPGTVYIVKSGVMALEASDHASEQTRIIEFLHPGDLVSGELLTASAGATLRAITDGSLVRLCGTQLQDVDLLKRVLPLLDAQSSRLALINLMMGLTVEARVATFLMWLAVRTSHPSSGPVTLSSPMSRDEAASHLLINRDTLSRVLSKLRQQGIIAKLERRRLLIADWKGLCALSPLADMVTGLAA